jgi:hypothetical protein
MFDSDLEAREAEAPPGPVSLEELHALLTRIASVDGAGAPRPRSTTTRTSRSSMRGTRPGVPH